MNPLHRIYYWFKDLMADAGAFFRFGLKNNIRHGGHWISDRFYMANLWRKSLPASRKVRQQEARDEWAKIRTNLMAAPHAFLTLAWNIVASPKKAWNQITGAWNRFRSLSVKEMFAALWRSYVAIIAGVLYFFENLYFRWVAFSIPFRIITVCLLIGVIAVGASSRWLVDEAKKYRAGMLLEEADELKGLDYDVKSYEKLRSAALLNPDDTDIINRTIEAAHQLRSRETVWWSERKVRMIDDNAESMAKVIDYAIDFHDIPIGAKYLVRLQSNYPDAPETIDTELKILMAQGRRNQALLRAKELLQEGRETPLVHDIYIGLSNVKRPEIADEVRQHILENLYRDDEIGKYLCERVVFGSKYEGIDYLKVIEHLRQFDDTDHEAIIIATGRAYTDNQITREQAIEAILNEYDLTKLEDREDAYKLLNFFGLGGVDAELLADGDLSRQRALTLQYIQSLILSDRPDLEKAQHLLQINNRETAMNESDKHFWQSLIQLHKGDTDGYTLEMIQALRSASDEDWAAMEKLLKRYTGPAQQLVFYRELCGLTDNSPYSTQRYVELLYLLGRKDELFKNLRHIQLENFTNDPRSLGLLIYLKSAFGMDLEQCRYLGETMVEEYPELHIGYISLAFAYYQSGEPGLAKQLLQLPLTLYRPDELSNYQQIAAALIKNDPSLLPTSATAVLPIEEQIVKLSHQAESPSNFDNK